MAIILKYVLKNIAQKKMRTIMIVVSIMLSCALLFSTITISKTFESMLVNQIKKYSGSAEIMVQADSQGLTERFFEMKDIDTLNVDYQVGVIRGSATYQEDQSVVLGGYTQEDLVKMHGTTFIHQLQDQTFTDQHAIIGEGEAVAFGLKIGDGIQLDINGENHTLIVYAIADSNGMFDYDGNSMSVVIPLETLAGIYERSGMVNTLYLKTSSQSSVTEVMDTLSNEYEGYIVKTTITQEEIDANIGQMSSMFTIMLLLVILISVFIIYTSFKVISMERLPVVGTFRSIGATKKMTSLIIMSESAVYGIVGGLFGCLLGIGILKFMMNTMAYNAYTGVTIKGEMIFGMSDLLITFGIAVVLSIISSIIPILRVNKYPIRDIVLNTVKGTSKENKYRAVIGIIFCLVTPVYLILSIKPTMLVGMLLIVISAVGLIIIVPEVSKLLVLLLEQFIHRLFGNEGLLAVKNIKHNKSITNNITLLTIGIASLLMINTVSQSVANELTGLFDYADFELVFYHSEADEDVKNRLELIPGIESTYAFYQINEIKIKEKNDYVQYVWGVDAHEYYQYWQFPLGNKEAIMEQFDKDRNVIISHVLQQKFNLDVGDTMTLQIKNKLVEYKVLGVTTSLMQNGSFILIPEAYLKVDAGVYYYSEIMIRTDRNPEEVVSLIDEAFDNELYEVHVLQDSFDKNMESNNQIFGLLTGFSIITMVIGVFGILNNFIVSFISRKRSLAIYRSVGMSKKQLLKMLLIESFISGLIGGATGLLGGILFIKNAEVITHAMSLPIEMFPSLSYMIIAIVSGVLVSTLASISPVIKNTKHTIVESIKYE